MSETFQLVFRGKLISGFELAQVQQSVAALFKTDVSRVADRLALPKWVIRTGMAQEQANKMRDVLRQAGLVTAVVVDDASAAPAAGVAVAPAPTEAQTAKRALPSEVAQIASAAAAAPPTSLAAAPARPISPVSAPQAEDFEAAGAKSIVHLNATTQIFATPVGGLSADVPSGPLEIGAKPTAPVLDLSRFSLAPEGAVMDTSTKAQAVAINTGSLSLAAAGMALAEPKPAMIKAFDTSALSLDSAPIPEKKPNSLWAEME